VNASGGVRRPPRPFFEIFDIANCDVNADSALDDCQWNRKVFGAGWKLLGHRSVVPELLFQTAESLNYFLRRPGGRLLLQPNQAMAISVLPKYLQRRQ
jgi:hypothetical protein